MEQSGLVNKRVYAPICRPVLKLISLLPQMDDFKNRLQLQHEKDLAKLLAKITRLEASRDELVREKGETSKEMLGLKAEVRESMSDSSLTRD